jgi:recombination protein RecR
MNKGAPKWSCQEFLYSIYLIKRQCEFYFMQQGIIENLITELTKLPGIGRKTAQRLAFFILAMSEEDAKGISKAINEVKEKARFCNECFNITEKEVCIICSSNSRDRSKLCVVEEPSNILVIERSKSFNGLYHVLLGALSPIDGFTPDRLKINELIKRIGRNEIKEIIIATNPNTKGEMTAQYIREMLKPFNVKVTRIAYGLPIGGDIEFADEVTLSKAIEGRREM